jgi:phospholipase C
LPGADGKQAGLAYADAAGVSHPTHPLAPDYQGCADHDPDHSFAGGRVEYNDGRCDGWLRAGLNDLYSIGYYTREDLPFLGHVATRFAVPDRYFCAILGPTFPNRFYQHAAQTDRLSNTSTVSTLPTIWDRLADKGLDGRYYYSDLAFLSLWGSTYEGIMQPVQQFLADAAAGSLPQVAYVDPAFNGELAGTSDDDHPHGDIRAGEAFLDRVFRAVTTGPAWSKTVLIINFDEWGGFFDHVPPPAGPTTAAERALGYTDGLRGFRVPCVVVSPWSQHGRVSHTLFDHTSVLKLIEWRFGLEPLTERDATANNLATVLDFDQPRLEVEQPDVPAGPFGGPCP